MTGERTEEARYDERLMTNTMVASSELSDKTSNRRARIGKADVCEFNLCVRAHFNESSFADKGLHLSRSP